MAIDTGTNSSNYPSSINSVFGHMAARQTALEEHPFFQYLLTDPRHEWLVSMSPGMSFWVMVYPLQVLCSEPSGCSCTSDFSRVSGTDR